MNLPRFARNSLSLFAALWCLLPAPNLLAASSAPIPTEPELLAILASDAAPGDKAMACKKLAIYGGDKAVPALAGLLPDPQLSSWARIPLEAIPGPAASRALRDALPKLQGRLLVGVINSLAVRQDPRAVSPLVKCLANADPGVASAAAEALGRLGGTRAASALQKVVAKGPAELRPAAALGCSLAADKYLAAGSTSKARKLYDALRAADVPRQRVLEATRGAILARGDSGIPMLTELLRSSQKDLFAVALSTARELPGSKATAALGAEISRADAARAPLLLLALADRKDPAATPTIFDAAKSGPKNLRLAALPLLERIGGVAAIPVLLDAAVEDDAAVSQAGKAALVALQDNGADPELLRRLAASSGRQRQVLLQTAAQRHLDAAVPGAVASLRASEPDVRKAAVQAVGALGGPGQLEPLISLAQQASSPAEREPIEAALLAICGRSGSAAMPALLRLAEDPKAELRIIALHAFASAGGNEALDAVGKRLEDPEESVQDEAVRTLASWPNTWPDDPNIAAPLLALSRSGKKPSHQVLALRAYLQCLQGDKKLRPADRVARLNEIVPLIQRPEDKRLAISVASGSVGPGTLALLSQLASDSAIADDAFAAILDVASRKSPGISKEDLRKALQLILDSSAAEDLKKKAQERLKGT